MIFCENGFDWTCLMSLVACVEFWYTVFWGFVLPVVLGILFFLFVFRKEYRFYTNLKRKILVIVPDGVSDDKSKMLYEMKLLKRSGYFEIEDSCEYSSIEWDGDHGMIIFGYKGGDLEALKKVFDKAGGKIPVIIYTYGNNTALTSTERNLLADSPLHLIANFPLNLLNGVFTTLAVYKYGKSK